MRLNFTHTERFLPIIMFLFGFWFFCIGILGSDLSFIPGDLGDSRFINYLLEHGYLFLSGETESFWNAAFMHPYPNTIAISDNMIGTLPIYSLWRLVGLEQETAYQFWWMTICVLNYWITFWIMKKWFKRTNLAILVAFVFAFSIFNLQQLNYMQMTIRFMIPVVIYAATRLVETGNTRYLFYFSMGLLIQFYSVIYTGFFLFYFSIGYIVVYAFVTKKWGFVKTLFSKGQALKSMFLVLVSASILLILMLPYFETSQALGLKLYDDVKWNIPMINGYLMANTSSLLWGWMLPFFQPETDNWWLQSVFIGMIPIAFIIAIPALWVYWWFKKVKVNSLLLALTIVIVGISLLFIRLENGLTLYAAIFKFPGMNSMRVLNRYMNVQLFFILLFIVVLLKEKKSMVVYALIALFVFDNAFMPSQVKRISKKEIIDRRTDMTKLVDNLREKKHTSFALISGKDEAYVIHLDAMMASLYTHLPTVNGYSSSAPNEFGSYFKSTQKEGLNSWMEFNKMDSLKTLIIELP